MRVNSLSTRFLESLAQAESPELIRQKLITAAKALGIEKFRIRAAREVMAGTRPERAIPDVYHPYRALVRDGIQFFLSHISLDRLLDVVVHQLRIDRDASTEERLLGLVKHFPTLHKLGQIIARNQHVDPVVRRWLIHLENGQYGTSAEDLLPHITGRLSAKDEYHRVKIEPQILSEASVGAVIPFTWTGNSDGKAAKGVFKVLKPKIKENLAEELAIFEKMAAFFEDNRHRYTLKQFKFLDVFKDVAQILEKEIDLNAEQSYLRDALRFYDDVDRIVIPKVMTLSDDTMTAMAYIDGQKITDAELTQEQRSACAATLAASLICRPIFARGGKTLFHGDPHAGNILWCGELGAQDIKIALLDWSLAGHLDQEVRIKVVQFIKNVITNDRGQICQSIRSLAKTGSGKSAPSRTGLWRNISSYLKSKDAADFSLLKKAFWLLEQLSYDGIVFSKDLMLFRKAIFTLEGVIYDLDPHFNMDAFLYKYMGMLLAQEMPSRFGRILFLQTDKAEYYQSLLSNSDLHMMMLNQYAAIMKRHTQTAAQLLEKQTHIMRLMLN